MTAPRSDADALMARRIGNQLFDVWKERQESEQRATRRWLGGSIPAWIALLFTIFTAAFSGGILRAQIGATAEKADKNERRIAALIEQRNETHPRLAPNQANVKTPKK